MQGAEVAANSSEGATVDRTRVPLVAGRAPTQTWLADDCAGLATRPVEAAEAVLSGAACQSADSTRAAGGTRTTSGHNTGTAKLPTLDAIGVFDGSRVAAAH